MQDIVFLSIFYLLLFSTWSSINISIWGLSNEQEEESEPNSEIRDRFSSLSYYTTKQVEQFAYLKGMVLKPTIQGIYITVDAYPVDSEIKIGYLSAFLRPIPKDTLQFETIQIRGSTQQPNGGKVIWPQENGLISFILSSWALSWAKEKGSVRAELLVNNDSNHMYRILTRLYMRYISLYCLYLVSLSTYLNQRYFV